MAKSLPYFTPAEVVIHNKLDDFWVSFLGRVYDLTPFIQERQDDPAIKPILANAGKDISHWFEPDSGQLRHYVHPITEVSVPYTPHGRLPHVGPQVPTTTWKQRSKCRWWEDSRYLIGRLTTRARPIRLLNIYTGQHFVMSVCTEDNLRRIAERALEFNSHAFSYTFKYEGRVLDMDHTLDQNGIVDERDNFLRVGISETYFIPTLAMYFNDDLTVA